jgi:predicted amidohydrolase
MIVDPWGEAIAETGTGEAVITGTLVKSRLKEVRARMPLLLHRRKDLY